VLLDSSRSMTRSGKGGEYSVLRKVSQLTAQVISEWDKEGFITAGSQIEVYAVSNPDLAVFREEVKPLKERLFQYKEPPQNYKALFDGKGITVGSLPQVSDLKMIQENEIEPFRQRGYWTLFLSNTNRSTPDGQNWWGPLKEVQNVATGEFLLPVALPGGPLDTFSMDQGTEKAVREAFATLRQFWEKSSVATAALVWLTEEARTVDTQGIEELLIRVPELVRVEWAPGRAPDVALAVDVPASPKVAAAKFVGADGRKASAVTAASGPYAVEVELREPLVGETANVIVSASAGPKTNLVGEARVTLVLRGRALPSVGFPQEVIQVTANRAVVPVQCAELTGPVELFAKAEGGDAPTPDRISLERDQRQLTLTWGPGAALPRRVELAVAKGRAGLCFPDRVQRTTIALELAAPPTAVPVQPRDARIVCVPDPAVVTVAAGEPIQFRSDSGAAESVEWDFGDGSPRVAAASSEHAYAKPGAYAVVLTARSAGGVSTAEKRLVIAAGVPPVKPRAKFRFSPAMAEVVAGTEVEFINESEGAESYEWDFGDGSPKVTEANPNHRFAKGSTYSVSLLARAGTQEDRFGVAIPVGDGNAAVTAEFELAPPGTATVGEPVRFTNSSTNAARFEWDLGDGTALSTEWDVEHVFQKAGTYVVRLTAYDAGNVPAVRERTVVVEEGGGVIGWLLLALLAIGSSVAVIAYRLLRPRREIKVTLYKGAVEVKAAVVRRLLNLTEIGFTDDIRLMVLYDKRSDDLQVEFLAKGRAWNLCRRVPARDYNLPLDSPSAPVPLGQYDIEGTDYRLQLERVGNQ